MEWTPPEWFRNVIRPLSPICDLGSSVPGYLEALEGLGKQYPSDSVAIRKAIHESQIYIDDLRAMQKVELFSENSRPLRTVHVVDDFGTFVAAMGHLANLLPSAFSFPFSSGQGALSCSDQRTFAQPGYLGRWHRPRGGPRHPRQRKAGPYQE